MVSIAMPLSDMSMQLVIVDGEDVLPHEKFDSKRVDKISSAMDDTGKLKRAPIFHREGSKFITIDGHHRLEALKQRGCKSAVGNEIGFYKSRKHVSIDSRRDKHETFDQSEIIERALCGRPFSYQTTMHYVRLNGGPRELIHHHRVIAQEINFDLERLMRRTQTPVLIRYL